MSSSFLSDNLFKFGMNNIFLEKSLSKIQKAGIDIGYIDPIKKESQVDTDLFEQDILFKVKKMADFYILYFSLENSVRKLVADVLSEKYGSDWWRMKVPGGVKTAVEEKQKEERDTPVSIRSEHPLAYTHFGELIDIFNANWKDFADILRSQKSVQDTLSQFNRVRNIIAHSCELKDDEILRFKLLIKDWLRIQNE